MKTVVNTKVLLATILVAMLMIIACNCTSQEERNKTEKLVKQFNELKPGDLFLESSWNKPTEGLTLLLNKKVSDMTVYKLTIDDHDALAVNAVYLITLDNNNYITSIELTTE